MGINERGGEVQIVCQTILAADYNTRLGVVVASRQKGSI